MTAAASRLFANRVWAEAVAEELFRLGIRCVAACPGSRNSPLVLACARHSGLRTPAHVDERGAGYFALGWARATGEPAAVLVTSGTAVANLHPAVMEADLSALPMIVLSADRPGELQGLGANQTVDQHEIFGRAVRFFRQIPCADDPGMPGYGLAALDEAVFHARTARGPVHLNLAFREPLVDASWNEARAASPAANGNDGKDHGGMRFARWEASKTPWTDYAPAVTRSAASEGAARLNRALTAAACPILAIGALATEEEARAAARIARVLGLPVYADLLSGLRSEPGPWLKAFDRLLGEDGPDLIDNIDTVVQLGGRFISKAFETWLTRRAPRHLRFRGQGPRVDPGLTVGEEIWCPLEDLAAFLESAGTVRTQPGWPELSRIDDAVRKAGDDYIHGLRDLDELTLPGALSQSLPEGALLFAGNSMPVRDLSAWGSSFPHGVRILSNRGASGIDGLIATAAGAAFAAQKPAALLVGDLSLQHDLSSLSLPGLLGEAFVVLVVNNGGGGIFHFLPVSEAGAGFESHIALAHGKTFESAAAFFKLSYYHPETRADLDGILPGIFLRKEKALVEIRTDRALNLARHRELDACIRRALGG